MAVVRTRRIVDDAGAEAVIAAAEKVANENGHRVVFAVVDPWGEVIQLRRTQNAQIASSRVAVDKARTAAIFVRSSRVMEEQVTNGRLGALALHGVSALTGGIPLVVGGEVVGAIGTSGETPDQDEACSIAGAATTFSTVEVPALTFEGARLAADAVAAVSRQRGVSPVAAVVDAGGALVYLWRPDDAQVASAEVSVDKARTAAIYRRPSKDFEDQASGGRPSALHLARAVPLQGGMPILYNGHVIGGIGVSGATSAPEDQELATIGADAAGAAALAGAGGSADEAVFFSRAAVDDKFQTGGLLLDTSGYKIDAGRRNGPGDAECHASVVDVMHVVQGTATVVTGGEMVDAREVAAGETRARTIEGGTPNSLSEGDVLAVPNGVPHQFTDVSDPFLYIVVKVEAS